MKKLLMLIIVLLSLSLVACDGLDLDLQDEESANIEIQKTEYQDDVFVIYAENTEEAGYYKIEIDYVDYKSNIDITPYEFSTGKLYAEEEFFIYEFPIGENDVITGITVYSYQQGSWVETDQKLFAIPS